MLNMPKTEVILKFREWQTVNRGGCNMENGIGDFELILSFPLVQSLSPSIMVLFPFYRLCK